MIMEEQFQERKINPLLEKVRLPGKTYQLPSRGLFYENGELSEDVQDGEVYVYSYTALDELALNSPDRLLTGKAIDEVLGRCVPQVKKPRDLLRQDVDFLLTCLRVESYGPEIEINFLHTCEKAVQHSYMVNIQQIVQKTRKLDPTSFTDRFFLTLSNGQRIKFKPLTFQQTLTIYDKLALKKDMDNVYDDEIDLDKQILAHYIDSIESVDDITEKDLITEWFYQLRASWANEIVDRVRVVNDWGPTSKISLTCKDCSEEVKVDITTNPVAFFT